MKQYRAGIYLRLSKEQEGENNSIEAQREITTRYAFKKGYTIAKEYIDNGYSGILDTRPALNEMIIDITRGYINMVIVKDISRLTRNKNKTGWYTELFFPDNDVRFIAVTEFIDTGERYEIDDSIMLRGIANQYYIMDISKKVKANKKAMKESGKFIENSVPYGYKKRDTDKHQIMIDNKVAGIIIQIYDKYIEGETSSKIAEYLNHQKVKTPSQYKKMKNMSEHWQAEQINSILRNPFYMGNRIMNQYETDYRKKVCKKNTQRDKWIIKENTHEAIIPKWKYEKVQKIKQGKQGQKKVTYEFLLKDLVYCGECQKRLQYKIYKKANEPFYKGASFCCSVFYKKRCRNSLYMKEKELNEIVKREVIKRLKQMEIEEMENKLLCDYKKSKENTKKEMMYRNKIEKLERRKKVLYEKKCEQYIGIQEFKIEFAKVKEEIKKYEGVLKSLKEVVEDKQQDKKRIEEIIENLKNGIGFTNELLKEVIHKVELYPKNRIAIFFK